MTTSVYVVGVYARRRALGAQRYDVCCESGQSTKLLRTSCDDRGCFKCTDAEVSTMDGSIQLIGVP